MVKVVVVVVVPAALDTVAVVVVVGITDSIPVRVCTRPPLSGVAGLADESGPELGQE